jgi:uncharacterized protein YbjT (DUF2867 family)
MSSSKSLKLLVFGGGGKVARHLARLGSRAGFEIVSVVRNEDQCVSSVLRLPEASQPSN